jgi:hypothetical protein
MTDLRSALVEWTDFDGAEFEVAKCLGMFSPAATWGSEGLDHKYLFWSANPIGDRLYEILARLVAMSVLEINDDRQFRWNQSFDLVRASQEGTS